MKNEQEVTYGMAVRRVRMKNECFLPHVCELVALGHKVSIRAKGVSMRPFLETDRDVAVLAKAERLRVGDVVLAEISERRYVLHRIERIDGDLVILRGDGNVRGTETCGKRDVRAVAVEFERKGKTYSVKGVTWRLYSAVWTGMLPFRRYLLALYRLWAFGTLRQNRDI